MCEFDLVVGKKYKVRLKPLEDLLSRGVLTESDLERPWFKLYLGGCVGTMVFMDNDFQLVDWGDGNAVVWCYCLHQLKILGEV